MHRIAMIAALSLFAAATARAVSSSFEERERALRDEASTQRKKLGLDDYSKRTKLYATYPTPEFGFQGEPTRLGCAQDAQITASGSWPKGTTFLIDNDGAQLVDVKEDGHTLHARLKTGAVAVGDVELLGFSPVSGASRGARAAAIRAQYELDLKFDDGWTAHFAPSGGDARSGQVSGSLQWKKAGKTRESEAQVDPGTSSLKLTIAPGPEMREAFAAHSEKLSAPADTSEIDAAQAQMEPCMKKQGKAQETCLEKAGNAMAQAGAKLQARLQQINTAFEASLPRDAWACETVELRVKGNAVTGVATCAANTTQKVTGTIACTGPIAAQ